MPSILLLGHAKASKHTWDIEVIAMYQILIMATRNRKLWRATITQVLNGHFTYKIKCGIYIFLSIIRSQLKRIPYIFANLHKIEFVIQPRDSCNLWGSLRDKIML